MGAGELSPRPWDGESCPHSFPAYVLGEQPGVVLEISLWGSLTNSATNQAEVHVFELVHSNIYLMYELLEHLKASPADPKLQEIQDILD